ncbi:MAG TPA: CIA30 family protein [Terriglobia bacterium]|nr:CIA30 family protein [Terriglobia bacterium]
MAALRIALMNIRLATRLKTALFFTFIFPLIFLFAYGGIFAHGDPKGMAFLFGPVVVLQVIGSTLWGLGMRSVMDRERGALRRFRLAPIGAGTIVMSNALAGYLLFLPTVALLLVCARFFFHMPMTIGLPSLLVLITVGDFAFAGIGLTIGSIANTMQEAQVYNNIVFFPLLFLSGATIPLAALPHWLQRVAAFLPATYLVSAFQGVMTRSEPLLYHASELGVLAVSGTFGMMFAWKLFRWEKEEQIPRSRKLWSLAFLIPLVFMGAWMNSSGSAMAGWAKSFNTLDDSGKTHDAGPAPPGSESGLVSDFDEGAPTAKFGSGWFDSTDQMMGGKSTEQFKVVEGGADGTEGSLLITGEIAGGTTFPWAGAMFMPGTKPFAPANLSSKNAIRFWAKGDGKTYRVMLFSASAGPMPAIQEFDAGPEWKQYNFPLASFHTDGHDIEGVLFSGGPAPGSFAFQIDDVELK